MAATTWTFNPHGIFFDVQNNNVILPTTVTPLPGVVVPPVPSATTPEAALLRDYGKIMYYKIEFGHNPVMYTTTRYAICLEVMDFTHSSWNTTVIATDFLGGELFHNTGSSEIVVNAPQLYSTNFNVQRQHILLPVPGGFPDINIQTYFDTPNEIWLSISQ